MAQFDVGEVREALGFLGVRTSDGRAVESMTDAEVVAIGRQVIQRSRELGEALHALDEEQAPDA